MSRLVVAFIATCLFLAAPALAEKKPTASASAEPTEQWVQVHRATGLWSKAGKDARLFRKVEPGTTLKVVRPQSGSRLYVWEPITKNYAYVDAADVGPIDSRKVRVQRDHEAEREVSAKSTRDETDKKSKPGERTDTTDRMPTSNVFWSGTARVTMYTCVELGGCNRTASGLWPYEGVVAVDPRVIPLGSIVWIEGLGTFLAADTGSAVRGAHIDVYVTDYGRARQWGIRHVPAAAYVNR
jgi:3D (Asp-Asp-Asp) domain-containing protein